MLQDLSPSVGLNDDPAYEELDVIAAECVANLLLSDIPTERELVFTVIVADMEGQVISMDSSHPGRDTQTTPDDLSSYASLLDAIAESAHHESADVRSQLRYVCPCAGCSARRAAKPVPLS
jgi:hypothetical protein